MKKWGKPRFKLLNIVYEAGKYCETCMREGYCGRRSQETGAKHGSAAYPKVASAEKIVVLLSIVAGYACCNRSMLAL